MTEEILGYDAEGNPIHQATPGMMYTQCIISCARCSKIIRGVGGPMHGALCLDCVEGINQEADFKKFAALATEAAAITRDAGAIIQNEGFKPSLAEIKDWASDCDAKLNDFIQRYRAHVRRVGMRLHRGLYK